MVEEELKYAMNGFFPNNFCEWALSNGYKQGLEIDRIDVNGDYEPSNCRWVSRKVNCQNQRRTVLITIDNETHCAAEWERKLNLRRCSITNWINRFGIDFVIIRMKEVIETGTYTRYTKGKIRKMLKDKAINIVKQEINNGLG